MIDTGPLCVETRIVSAEPLMRISLSADEGSVNAFRQASMLQLSGAWLELWRRTDER